MQKAESRRQKERGGFAAVVSALTVLSYSSLALADGGTLRLSQRHGDCQVSVFTTPSTPCVGPLDVSVLVQDAATGKVRDDLPVMVRLQSIELPDLTLEQPATASAATNKLFRAAVIDVPEAGNWRARILVGGESDSASESDRNLPTLAFDFDVAALPPEWLSLAAWVGWPIGMVALFLIHQCLVAKSPRKRSFRPQIGHRQNCVDTI